MQGRDRDRAVQHQAGGRNCGRPVLAGRDHQQTLAPGRLAKSVEPGHGRRRPPHRRSRCRSPASERAMPPPRRDCSASRPSPPSRPAVAGGCRPRSADDRRSGRAAPAAAASRPASLPSPDGAAAQTRRCCHAPGLARRPRSGRRHQLDQLARDREPQTGAAGPTGLIDPCQLLEIGSNSRGRWSAGMPRRRCR